MGFKRPEVQIFSPRPGRRGRKSVRGDFLFASLFKNPRPDARRPLLPFRVMSASLLQLCRYEHTPVPARLPHSAGALRAILPARRLSVRGDFLFASLFKNPRQGVPPSAPPFPRNVRFAPSTLPLQTSARPRSLTTFRGRAPRDIAPETLERPRRFFIRFAHQNPRRGIPQSAPSFPRNVRFAPSLCSYEHTPFPARLPHSAGALRAMLPARRKSVRGDFLFASLTKIPAGASRRPLLPFRVMSASLLHFAVTNIRPSPLAYHIPRARLYEKRGVAVNLKSPRSARQNAWHLVRNSLTYSHFMKYCRTAAGPLMRGFRVAPARVIAETVTDLHPL